MNYKGFRVDRKFNVYDLNGNILFEGVGNFEIAKEKIDKYLEEQHRLYLPEKSLMNLKVTGH